MVLVSPNTWGQDGMANITAGEYRPLYLSIDSPLVSVTSFRLDKQPVTNREFKKFVAENQKWQRDVVPSFICRKCLFKPLGKSL